MKAQVLYNAQHDGVFSGDDLQEFFLKNVGDYSISGKRNVPTNAGRQFIANSLFAQETNSPSLKEWAMRMRDKYGINVLS